jgi:oligoendopeptidase F
MSFQLIKKNVKKVLVIMMLLNFGLGVNLVAQDESGGLIKRSEIADKYKWNLNDIYQTEEAWENDFKWLNENVVNYKNYEGTLGNSAQDLLKALKFDEQIGIKFGRLHLYAFLSKDLDLADTKYQGIYDRTMGLASKLSAAGSFMRPEILAIPETKLWDFVADEPELKVYEQQFKEMLRKKAHTLSKSKR